MSFKENWRQSEIGKEIELSYGKGLTKRDRNEGDYPVYGSNGITDYHEHYLIEAPGIIVGRKGTIGKVEFTNKNFWPIDTTYYVNLLKENNDFKFWYYFLKSFPLEDMNSHSAVPGLNREQVYKLKCLVPPLKVQEEISKVLSSLDKKIENNKKINKTLEEMAQEIYKSWFVDFEPFQDEKFIESELGMIPESWEVIKLKKIVSLKNGKRPNEKKENPQKKFKVPVIGASGVMAYTEESLYDEPILVVGRVGTLGVVQRYNSPCWTSDNTIVIKPDFYEYVYQILKTINFKSLNRGSTQPLIAQKDIKSQKVVLPPENILKEFTDIVSKIFRKVKNNKKENQSLKELRDSLLPKLMSGEISVPLDEEVKEVN